MKLTWEETIRYIRTNKDFQLLVKDAYFEEDLPLNVERFRKSPEFTETLQLLRQYAPDAKTLLDIGSGNGISALAFALNGYDVTVSEPDPSETIGAGAIKKLKQHYKVGNLEVYEDFAEDIGFPDNSFDVVYVRQAMHHAYDLKKFIQNLATVLKPGGILLTIRDHVIFDQQDKDWFLESHPLHKFYGGENAYTEPEYRDAIASAGLTIRLRLRYFDSVINYFPLTGDDLDARLLENETELRQMLRKKLPLLGSLPGIFSLYKAIRGYDRIHLLNERSVPGRMYSFVAVKSK